MRGTDYLFGFTLEALCALSGGWLLLAVNAGMLALWASHREISRRRAMRLPRASNLRAAVGMTFA
jgi:hypothetical protein